MLSLDRSVSPWALGAALSVGLGLAAGVACEASEPECGPAEGVVDRVIDGDTIWLTTGEHIRYLLVDTPEVSPPAECFGPEAAEFNRDAVEGRTVQLRYDHECTDRYDRLLAYVEVDGRSINELLLSRGYACVLQIPPNGNDRVDEYRRLEQEAQAGLVGIWGACAEDPCD